jgi:hypothetical protein
VPNPSVPNADDIPAAPGGISKSQAVTLLTAAAKSGVAPQREHLDIVYGPAMAVEILALIRRKETAAGAEMARRIATRNAQTLNRAPSGPTEVDIEAAIREALAEFKAGSAAPPRPAANSQNVEELDPRALADNILNPPRRLGGKSGHYIVEKVGPNGRFNEMHDAHTHLPIGISDGTR